MRFLESGATPHRLDTSTHGKAISSFLRKGLILAYSPEGRKGQTIGAYYLARDGLVGFAALLGAGLWKLGPGVKAIGALGTAFYAAAVRRTKQPAQQAEPRAVSSGDCRRERRRRFGRAHNAG